MCFGEKKRVLSFSTVRIFSELSKIFKNLNPGSIRSKCKGLFVAAIDFGTTYSGYAFSSTNEWSKVLTSNWTGGKVITLKTPTAILLDSEQKFLAFGYEAEDMYMDLARDEEHEDHYFFHRFKMILHSEKVCKQMINPGCNCTHIIYKCTV